MPSPSFCSGDFVVPISPNPIEYVASQHFKRFKIIFGDDMEADEPGMMVVEVNRDKVIMDRPMAVGFTVLEMSKVGQLGL